MSQEPATEAAQGTVLKGTAVTDLGQDISGTYTEAEVQAISDKVDELLAVLRTAKVITT